MRHPETSGILKPGDNSGYNFSACSLNKLQTPNVDLSRVMKSHPTKSQDEAITLLLGPFAQRLVQMGPELAWAFGRGKLARGKTPPAWVKSAILGFRGPMREYVDTLLRADLTSEVDRATIMGQVIGVTKGGRMLFNHPMDTTDFRPEMQSVALEFQKRVVSAANPLLEEAEVALSKIPEDRFQATPEALIAFQKAKSLAVENSAKPTDDRGTATNELLFMLWLMWPQAKTATSVRDLYEWISSLGFVSTSAKNFEKLCRNIGYKVSTRGRKKKRRIPTKRSR